MRLQSHLLFAVERSSLFSGQEAAVLPMNAGSIRSITLILPAVPTEFLSGERQKKTGQQPGKQTAQRKRQ